ncbi:IS6 family transposase [Terasakiella sp.]|uniref:IS6 family transposase n=1 Tax=Terasakiella sp. TaxID=2034861 RepID=UPI003AA83D25
MNKHFRYFKSSSDIIRFAVMMYIRFPLSLRNVEDILHERGIDISHETIRFWWNRFGPLLAKEIKKKRGFSHSNWRWHIDEVFVKVKGERHYLWRVVDHEGTVLDAVVTKKRDKKPALKVLKRLLKKYGKPTSITTDKLKSYSAALKEIGMAGKHETGQWMNNRAENSHLVFRRRERGMNKFRSMTSLQKFLGVQTQVQNHFSGERHLNKRHIFKESRSASLVEWRSLLA